MICPLLTERQNFPLRKAGEKITSVSVNQMKEKESIDRVFHVKASAERGGGGEGINNVRELALSGA